MSGMVLPEGSGMGEWWRMLSHGQQEHSLDVKGDLTTKIPHAQPPSVTVVER
jgi:hypothetical protein